VDQGERSALVDDLVERLDQRGVPEGAWLVEIAQVRASLRSADDLLRRLEAAMIRGAARSTPGAPP
jgi:hypothetical protein